jgi:hypothetical protein
MAAMSNPASLADLRKIVQAGARAVQRTFVRPEDDWVHVMLVQSPRGVEPMILPNEAFASVESKQLLDLVLREAIVRYGVFRYALLLNSHMKSGEGAEELEEMLESGKHVSEMSGSHEALVLAVGDAEVEEIWVAEIKRDAAGIRTLAPWEEMEGGEWEGRFTHLGDALRAVR